MKASGGLGKIRSDISALAEESANIAVLNTGIYVYI